MFKIGEFARMGQVSVRTLRHYEDLGLLRPVEIDRFTGYRYYSTTQLPRLNRILALKDMGLSLEQIGQLLDADLTPDQLKGMLMLKQAEFKQQLDETQMMLGRIDAWLSRLEEGGSVMSIMNSYEITLKAVEPMLVAALRQTIPAYGYLAGPFRMLRSYLAEFGFIKNHASLIIWHFSGTDEEQGFEVELLEQLDEPVPGSEQIKVYTLPGVELVASVTHLDGLDQAYQAYQALASWVEAHDYKVCGPTRQIHHAFNPQHDPSTYIAEFQLPIEKLAV
jgi:DNA-binding transcriptional MerR regulator/effector-binding domain-containing protein